MSYWLTLQILKFQDKIAKPLVLGENESEIFAIIVFLVHIPGVVGDGTWSGHLMVKRIKS